MITHEFLRASLARGRVKTAELSDSAKSSLVGAGIGAGIGGLSWLLRPKDRDQNQWREALMSALSGAALGGAAGWGYNRLSKSVSNAFSGESASTDKQDEQPAEQPPEQPAEQPAQTQNSTGTADTQQAQDQQQAQDPQVSNAQTPDSAQGQPEPYYFDVPGSKFKFTEPKEGYYVYYPKDEVITDGDMIRQVMDGQLPTYDYASLMEALDPGSAERQWIHNAVRDGLESGAISEPYQVQLGNDGATIIIDKDGKRGYTYTPPQKTFLEWLLGGFTRR